MGLQEQNWFFNIVRPIFGFFDRLVYRLIKWVLFGVFDLSALSTNSEVFNGIYQRLYVILGVFMAFKLSFSFFQYIINPESMGGKSEQGVGKLFSRVFIMLFALMVLPAILFGREGDKGLLARAQDAFLPVVPRLIFGADSIAGNNTTNGASTSSIEQISDEISITILRGFFFPSKEVDTVCDPNTSSKYEDIKTLDEFAEKINETCAKKGDARNVVGLGTKYYVYNYLPFVSTIVGVLVVALLLGITLDVAKRIFKLIILEIIAPIPIMSLIDPKSSKGGAFQSWIKSLTSTFVDIFLKFGLLYLVIVLIHMIVQSHDNGGLFTNFPEFQESPLRASYLILILILGLIFFAKEAPKFIKDALGIKGEGGGLFDDLKTVGKAAGLVGGAAVGAAGVLGSGVAGFKASRLAEEENHKGHNLLKNVGAGLAGALGGANAARKGLTGKDAGIGAVMKAQADRNAKALGAGAAGSTWWGRVQTNAGRVFTGETESDRLGRQLSTIDAQQGIIKSIKSRASGEMVKKLNTRGSFGSLGGNYNYKTVKASFDAAKAAGQTSFEIKDVVTGAKRKISTEEAELNIGGLLKSNEEDYIATFGSKDELRKRGLSAAEIDASYDATLAGLQNEADTLGITNSRSRKDLNDQNDALEVRKAQTKHRHAKAQANDRYSSKK